MCARARDYSAAVDAFRLYADSSLAPDAFAYSGLISAAGKAGEMRAAKKALCDAIDAGACDDGVYNSFIDACARSGDWDAARETATRMRDDPRVRPNVRTYNSLITAAAKARNVRAAKEALRELDEDLGRDAATDRTYGAALAAVAAGVGVALETETSAAGAVDADADAVADADVAATAKEATVQMGTVATVTRGETAELVRWGLEVYRRAEDAGCGGNDHALSSLFTALARAVAAGAWPGDDAVTRCVGIVNALVRESDDVLSDNVLSDIENVGRGRKAKAKAPKPNAAVWSALVSVCARAGRAREALDALELMRARGHALDSYTLASALTACRGGVAGASAASSDANGVFATGPAGGRRRRDALEGAREAREGLTVFERAPKSASASAYVRNAAIALYAAVGRVDAAFALYEEMKAESAIDGGDDARTFSSSSSSSSAAAAAAPGSSETTSASAMDTRRRTAPDTITYNTLLHSCGGRSATDGAEWAFSLVRDMRSARVPRSTRTYVGLMNAAARGAPIGRGAAAAKAVFDAAEEDDTVEGGAGNAYTYTALIDAQVKGGDPRAAFDTYEIMKRRNITPSVVTFGCLLNACGNIKSADDAARSSDSDSDSADVEGVDQSNDDVAGDAVERAYALLGEMTERGVCPNDRCQNALVRVVSEAGRIDDMLEEVKAIARRRGRFERATLEGVVRALCRAAYAERALRILSWMDARGYAPRAPTYRALVQTCASEGQVVWAWTLHQRMTRAGHRTDKASASGIVSALCRAAMATDAGEARVMLRRATEVYERCEAYGVAVEGEGEANPWDDDDDDDGGGGGDANRASERRGMTVEEELASFEAAAADDDDDDDDGAAGAASPACPLKLEAPRARPNDARTPAGEILTASALRDMITASARIGDVAFALRLYRVDAARDALRPSKVASSSSSYEHNADDGGVRANVYEALVEACCHNGDVNAALEVFDDLKANDVVVSKVTLAFLESRCRREGVPDWRVYDVCAQMRKQVSAKKERRLAESVPRKTSSHHVRGAVEVGGYDDDDEGGDGDGDAYAGADGSVASAATASGGGGGGASSYDFYDEDEDDSYGAAGARRRSKESEEAWERARRAGVKSSAGGDRAKRDGGGGGDRGRVFEREVDLDWISKPLGDIYEGYYDDRAADAKGLDPLQAELRTKGLGARRKGGGR